MMVVCNRGSVVAFKSINGTVSAKRDLTHVFQDFNFFKNILEV